MKYIIFLLGLIIFTIGIIIADLHIYNKVLIQDLLFAMGCFSIGWWGRKDKL